MNACRYLLEADADEHRDTLLGLSRNYTRRELCVAVDQVAAVLRERGLRKGMMVILIADNSFFWVAAYLGGLKAGGTVVPLAPGLEHRDLADALRSTDPLFAFVQAKYASVLLSSMKPATVVVEGQLSEHDPVLSHSIVSFDDVLSSPIHVQEYEEVDPNRDIATIMFTSGSTGQARGVMVSHRNIAANTDSIIEYLNLHSADRMMVVLPFHYCFGTSLLHTHLRIGGSLVLDHRFMFPDKVLQRIAKTQCTGFAGVPSHYQILLRSSSLRKMEFPALRYVQQAGGNLAPVFLQELRESLPNARIFVMYGQTEATARLSYLPPEFLKTKLGSIGKGIPGVQLAVVKENGVPVHPGEIGEIVATGDNIALGYWREPEETVQTFRNGSLRTGDLATVDKDGFIYIVDRAKNFLKCGGNRVSCKRIEEMLLRFPDLIEAAVIGIPDERNGEAVKAFVIAKPGANSNLRSRLKSFCTETFPSHLVPKEIVLVAELPKNAAGKVSRASLRMKVQSA